MGWVNSIVSFLVIIFQCQCLSLAFYNTNLSDSDTIVKAQDINHLKNNKEVILPSVMQVARLLPCWERVSRLAFCAYEYC